MDDLTEEQYTKLRNRGRELFAVIGDELNEISSVYVRRDTFRREADHNEICVALALLEQRMKGA